MENTAAQVMEGNIAIAEFMDFDWHEAQKYKDGQLQYSTSWDWLMPVVEKINASKKYDVVIFKANCHINDEFELLIETSVKTTLIDCVYRAVVKHLTSQTPTP